MTEELKGRIALVTGSSRGIGAEIARQLAMAGCDVAVNCHADVEAGQLLVTELLEYGGRAALFPCDVSNEFDVEALKTSIEQGFGSVDVLINNAGYIARPAGWLALKGEELRRTLDVNLTSVLNTCRIFAPSMMKKKWGRIVNVTSTYAYTGSAEILAYTAAKAGLLPITFGLARELGPNGITVNAVAPGNFRTAMIEGAPEGYKGWVESTTPLQRFGEPVEAAEAVIFLVTSNYINGHVLTVDGGHILNM